MAQIWAGLTSNLRMRSLFVGQRGCSPSWFIFSFFLGADLFLSRFGHLAQVNQSYLGRQKLQTHVVWDGFGSRRGSCCLHALHLSRGHGSRYQVLDR